MCEHISHSGYGNAVVSPIASASLTQFAEAGM
jgi:hypothetical protein